MAHQTILFWLFLDCVETFPLYHSSIELKMVTTVSGQAYHGSSELSPKQEFFRSS